MTTQRKQVVIVGAGFGGLAAAKGLVGAPVDVTVIDRSNHHLFQPLLYQVATAALNPSDIASATRSLFGPSDNVRVLMDEVTGVDAEGRTVSTAQGGAIAFDYLILATGADYSFFGHDEWAEHAPVLKTMEDALSIRERLLAAFERAELETSASRRARLLTFVVVGGGPTGVEMAGAAAELGRTTLAADYRRVRIEEIRIILAEAGDRLLAPFRPRQSRQAFRDLSDLGVEVRLKASVEGIDESGVVISGEQIPAANVIWCAGTKARDSARWLRAETARNNAVLVERDCSVPRHPEVFVIGDGASYKTANGETLPGLAPVAKQQGRYVARLIRARVTGSAEPPPFRYRNWGMMAVIGRSRAVADFGWLRIGGFPAWLLWSMVHLFLLVDFRSRSSVYLAWSYAWFTRNRVARLLTRKDVPDFRTSRKIEGGR